MPEFDLLPMGLPALKESQMVQPLPTAILGRTGLEVTRLGYGTGSRKQHPDDQQWGRLLNGVLDSGINFIDTANDYGIGRGERPI